MERLMHTGVKPIVIDELRRLAKQHELDRLLLFGSRARGDYHERSDIDLAAFGGAVSRFALDAEEETSTLLRFDIVNRDQPMQSDLRRSIEKEGLVLYEKI